MGPGNLQIVPPVPPSTSASSLAYLQPENAESSEMGRRRSLGIGLGYEQRSELPESAQTSMPELLSRRSSEANDTVPSPSSAPATPRVTALTHPSQYIHTHHPRRASLTPLGLNVISPVPPLSPRSGPSSAPILPPPPIRTKGFTSSSVNTSGHPVSPVDIDARRGSATSSSSTLTQTRPLNGFSPSSSLQQLRSPPAFGHASALPPRRSSITPSNPSLAIASPTKHHAVGRSSRPSTSDGNPRLHLRHRTTEGSRQLVTLNGTKIMPDYTRRGSMPQLDYAGWTRQKGYNPLLPPPRGSVDQSPAMADIAIAPPKLSPALPTEGFKFGSAPGASTVDISSSRPVSFVSSFTRQQKENMDVFQQAEAAEAERQQRAFFDATYGEDGRKARQRLSIGAAQPITGTSSPMGKSFSGSMASQAQLRRASLVLWEKMQASRAMETQPDISSGIVTSLPPNESANDLGPDGRRGSLPVDIPGALERRASQLAGITPGLEGQPGFDEMDEEEPDASNMSRRDTLRAPVRPLPPLLPLSDPGPRLLPSTLALHRANHLLSSRNLQAEPLPHPLPPSLHPPAPVDLAEFDIDFILAGSSAQMGPASLDEKDKNLKRNLPTDVVKTKPGALPRENSEVPITPTLNLARGQEGEDTFAKFVGEFDDEYGGRRGRWTFRAVQPTSTGSVQSHGPGSVPTSSVLQRSGSAQSSSSAFSGLDPLDNALRGEWDCHGAGKYELYASGEIKSVQTGSMWRVRKIGGREYELLKCGDTSDSSSGPSKDHYFLTTRAAHCEEGGIKYPLSSHLRRPPLAPTLPEVPEATTEYQGTRMGSTDSTTPKASFMSSSLPLSIPALGIGSPKKKMPRAAEGTGDVPPPSTAPERSEAFSPPRSTSRRSKSGERGESSERGGRRRSEGREKEIKSSKSIGGKLKRALKATVGHTQASEEKKAAREEREREKVQSQSWSPSASHRPPSHTHTHSHSHPIGQSGPPTVFPSSGGRIMPTRAVSATSPLATTSVIHDSPGEVQAGTSPVESALGSQSSRSAFASPRFTTSTIPESPGLIPDQVPGWDCVPDEAVAMVIPVKTSGPTRLEKHSTVPLPTGQSQALLVWYIPFNAETEDRPTTAGSSISSHSHRPLSEISRDRDSGRSKESQDKDKDWKSDSSSSHAKSSGIPKFQKLLKRRQSKERELRKPELGSSWPGSVEFGDSTRTPGSGSQMVDMAYPLPFRSFRVVARVIDPDELIPKSLIEHGHVSSISTGRTTPSSILPSPMDEPTTGITSSTHGQDSPGPLTLEGRNFPTVLAVCHSRSSGVEFVLEGLDRLGLCQGPSAWGPTGYEEWRGIGLSEEGRGVLDVLWAGCVCVMGLV